MFGLSAGEILLIAVIALVLFGNEKLPENLRKMIKSFGEMRKVFYQTQRSWTELKDDIHRNVMEEQPSQDSVVHKEVVHAKPAENRVSAMPIEEQEHAFDETSPLEFSTNPQQIVLNSLEERKME